MTTNTVARMLQEMNNMSTNLYAVLARGSMSNSHKVSSSRLAAGPLGSRLEPELSFHLESAPMPVPSSTSVIASGSESGFRLAVGDGAEQNSGRGAARKWKRSNVKCSYVRERLVCSGRSIVARIRDLMNVIGEWFYWSPQNSMYGAHWQVSLSLHMLYLCFVKFCSDFALHKYDLIIVLTFANLLSQYTLWKFIIRFGCLFYQQFDHCIIFIFCLNTVLLFERVNVILIISCHEQNI